MNSYWLLIIFPLNLFNFLQQGQVAKNPETLVSCYEIYTGDDIKNKESGDEYEFQNILTPQVHTYFNVLPVVLTCQRVF